jgi:hypothetical protein
MGIAAFGTLSECLLREVVLFLEGSLSEVPLYGQILTFDTGGRNAAPPHVRTTAHLHDAIPDSEKTATLIVAACLLAAIWF